MMVLREIAPGTHRPKRGKVSLLARVFAGAWLSLGLAHGQEPAREAPAALKTASGPDIAAEASKDPVIQALRERLASGELSLPQARALYDAAASPAAAALRSEELRKLAAQYDATGKDIDLAVAAGRLSAEEGAAKRAALTATLQSIAFSIEVRGMTMAEARVVSTADPSKAKTAKATDWVPGYLEKIGLSPEVSSKVLVAIERYTAQRARDGGTPSAEERAWFSGYLNNLGLTDKQVGQVEGAAQKAAKLAERSARQREEVAWIRRALADQVGLEGDSLESTLRLLPRIISAAQKEGAAFELDAGMRTQLVTIGLSNDQVDSILGLARRAAAGRAAKSSPEVDQKAGGAERSEKRLKLKPGAEAYFERMGLDASSVPKMRAELVESGLSDAQAEKALGGMLRVIAEMGTEWDDFELSPRSHDYFVSIGLSDEQEQLVLGLAGRALLGRDSEEGEAPGTGR